jgi:DNA-directed RNA polymerase subunit K/omega|tara:strand:- start:322 stop:576 length:255 start_codon:yes stop_codon:yes gene_type:complete
MAKISNRLGIKNIGGNQFELIMAAAHRARSYDAINVPLVATGPKRGMTALREIEAGVMPVAENREGMIEKYTTVNAKTVVTEDN